MRLGDYVMFEDPEELRSRLYENMSSDDDEDLDKKKDKDRLKDEKKLTMTEVKKKKINGIPNLFKKN